MTPDQLEALTMGDNITIIKDGKFIQKELQMSSTKVLKICMLEK